MVLGATKALCTLAVRGGPRIDILRDRGGADKGHTSNGFVVQQRINRFFVTIHHLEAACGQAGLDK